MTKTMCDVGIQVNIKPRRKKAKKSEQLKQTELYLLAIEKHWDGNKDKKALKRLLKIIAKDPKLKLGHLKRTGLGIRIKELKNEPDVQIKSWSKQVIKMWKQRFNLRSFRV